MTTRETRAMTGKNVVRLPSAVSPSTLLSCLTNVSFYFGSGDVCFSPDKRLARGGDVGDLRSTRLGCGRCESTTSSGDVNTGLRQDGVASVSNTDRCVERYS